MQFWNQIHRHKKDFLIPGDADKNKISKIFMTLLLYLPFGKGRGGGNFSMIMRRVTADRQPQNKTASREGILKKLLYYKCNITDIDNIDGF